MQSEYAMKCSQSLIKKYHTRNPFEIADRLGVEVIMTDSLKKLKGFYRVVKRNRYIILNSKNSARMNRIVCAHELGHDQLHRELAKDDSLNEFTLYDMASRTEYEANVFAANLLLDDNNVLDMIYDGYDIVQIAAATSSDINLVALKVDCLRSEGYDLRRQDHYSKFLK